MKYDDGAEINMSLRDASSERAEMCEYVLHEERCVAT